MLKRIALDILEEEINALACVSTDNLKVFQNAMKSHINAKPRFSTDLEVHELAETGRFSKICQV